SLWSCFVHLICSSETAPKSPKRSLWVVWVCGCVCLCVWVFCVCVCVGVVGGGGVCLCVYVFRYSFALCFYWTHFLGLACYGSRVCVSVCLFVCMCVHLCVYMSASVSPCVCFSLGVILRQSV